MARKESKGVVVSKGTGAKPTSKGWWVVAIGLAALVVLFALSLQSGGKSASETSRGGGGGSSGGGPSSSSKRKRSTAGTSITDEQVALDAQVGPGIADAEAEEYLVRMRRKLLTSLGKIDVTGHVPTPGEWSVAEPMRNSETLFNATVLHRDTDGTPMVVYVDDFLSESECQLLINWSFRMGLQRSVLAGDYSEGKFHRPISDIRTSSNAWCYEECFMDPAVHAINVKIAALAHKDWRNGELFQMLRYEPGQYYAQHTDFIEAQRVESSSVRVLTVFLYLNGGEGSSLVGGETYFPRLNVSVTPRRGRVAMWPNVLPGSLALDLRTEHAAMPVLKGVKYSANSWYHANDFLTPYTAGRTG